MEPTLMKMALWSKAVAQQWKSATSTTRECVKGYYQTFGLLSPKNKVMSPPKPQEQQTRSTNAASRSMPDSKVAALQANTQWASMFQRESNLKKTTLNLNNNPLDIIMSQEGIEAQSQTLTSPHQLNQTIFRAFTTSTMLKSRRSGKKNDATRKSGDLNCNKTTRSNGLNKKAKYQNQSLKKNGSKRNRNSIKTRKGPSSEEIRGVEPSPVIKRRNNKGDLNNIDNIVTTISLNAARNSLFKSRFPASFSEQSYKTWILQQAFNHAYNQPIDKSDQSDQAVSNRDNSDANDKNHVAEPGVNPARYSRHNSAIEPSLGVSPLPQPEEPQCKKGLPCQKRMIPRIKEKLWEKWNSLQSRKEMYSGMYHQKMYTNAALHEHLSWVKNERASFAIPK